MKLIDKSTASILRDSSLQNGEIVFTSLLFYQGKFLFLEDHLERLSKGVQFLFNKQIDFQILKQELSQEVIQNKLINLNTAVRINVTSNGYYFHLREFTVNQSDLKLQFSQNIRATSLRPSYLKLANYVMDFYERAHFPDWDDFIALNSQNEIQEVATSNIFWTNSKNEICTPELSSTNLDGVLRKNLLRYFMSKKMQFKEGRFGKEELLAAEEVFITNSIKGIRRIDKIQNKVFLNNNLYLQIKNEFGQFGELFYE